MINTGNEGVPHEQESRAQNSDTLDLEKLAANWNNNDQAKKSIRDEMMKQEVLTRLDKITMLMAADSKKSSATPDHAPVNRLNWDELYEISANVMDVYTKEVDECLAELDKFYRVSSSFFRSSPSHLLTFRAETILVARGCFYNRFASRSG